MPYDKLEQIKEAAHLLYRQGVEAQERGEYREAEEFYKRCLLMMKAIGSRNGEAASLHHLGTLFEAKGEYQKAKEYYRESYKLFKADQDQQNSIFSLFFQSVLCLKTKEYDESIQLVIESLQLSFQEGVAYVHEAWSRIRQLAGYFFAYREINYLSQLAEELLKLTDKLENNKKNPISIRQLLKITSKIGLLFQVSAKFWQLPQHHRENNSSKERQIIKWLLQTAVNLDQSPAIGLSFTDFVSKVIQERKENGTSTSSLQASSNLTSQKNHE